MSLDTNESLVRTILSSGDIHILAFVKTWCIDTPTWCFSISDYYIVKLYGIVTTSKGRDKRGIILFIKRGVPISSVFTELTDFGEYMSLVVNDNFSLVVFYRVTNRTIEYYNGMLELFTPLLNSTLPYLFLGDFNFQV